MEQIIKELDNHLKSAIHKFHEELQGVRTNRPSVQLVEDVKVNCYDQEMTVKQLGSLSIRPPRDIEITVWDKAVINPIMGAIQSSKMGFSVSNDANTIRVTLPSLTDERREEISRLVKKMAESTRIQIRTKRDEVIKKIKSAEDAGETNEDQAFKTKDKIQESINEANEKIESALTNKLRELNE
jgi:ribosome recycling factor